MVLCTVSSATNPGGGGAPPFDPRSWRTGWQRPCITKVDVVPLLAGHLAVDDGRGYRGGGHRLLFYSHPPCQPILVVLASSVLSLRSSASRVDAAAAAAGLPFARTGPRLSDSRRPFLTTESRGDVLHHWRSRGSTWFALPWIWAKRMSNSC